MKTKKHYSAFMLLFSFITFGFVFVRDKEEKLIEIAHTYRSYKQDINYQVVVTDSVKYKWTISLCAYLGEDVMGYHHKMDSAFFSQANDSISPHGNKLYKLFVKDQNSYQSLSNPQPVGQTLVKETWNVKKIPLDSVNLIKEAVQSKKDGNWYAPTQVSQLFVMYKEEPSALNDKGWVYGIVDIEGNSKPKVLSKGNISNCISCHKGTKYDRLFGNK